MIEVDKFRTGSFGVPFASAGELPPCCRDCRHLIHEESQVCFCEAPFYYYCGYSRAENLTPALPPCLATGSDPPP